MSHRPLVNLICWQLDRPSFKAGQTVLQYTSHNFDVSFQEIFSTWCSGGKLILVTEEERRDPLALWEILRRYEVARVFMPYVALQQLAEKKDGWLRHEIHLHEVITAGEQLKITEALVDLFGYLSHCSLDNQYGPTESHVVTAHSLSGPRNTWPGLPPIGRPIANAQIYLLDAHLQPVTVGVSGEIYIAGAGLARGYMNRPELTAENFIPNPFSAQPGACMYRTGDLARYLPDGSIEFLGRIDHQVKIRGFRIELGEIEMVLGQHPAVEDAVVIAREDVPGDKRLVAYVVASREPTPTFSELRSYLKEKLPDYMIPSAFVFLDILPLTPNGKVDRRALPTPEHSRPELESQFVAPRDDLELQLTKIWEKVLGVKNIGMKDNFFDLGGHSLLAVNLFARIQKIFGKDLPLATLFQAPTIGQLARIIRQEGFTAPWSSLVPIKYGGSKPPFFCIHGCTGRVLHFHDLAHHLDPEQPFYGLSALGLGKGQVPHYHIEEMAAHYINEIRTIQFNGPYFIGGSGGGCAIVLEMAHQLESQGQNLALIVLLIPPPLKPNISTTKLYTYRMYLRILFRNLIFLLKKRAPIPTLYNAFSNRVLWHFRIFHRFIPIEIHRWHRFTNAFRRAQFSYTPRAYQGRITCFLHDAFSLNYKKENDDWYKLAAGGLDIRFVPGNILTMWEEPHVQILAEKLTACLNEAQKNSW